MKLNKIKVYGRLRQDLGCSYFEAAVNSPREAFCFLNANYPDLEKFMSHQYYKVKMNGNDLTSDELDLQTNGVIQIIPYATGSLNLIIGAVSLVAGAVVKKSSATFLAKTLIGGITYKAAISGALTAIGSTLVIGGVTKMLMPTQQITAPTSSVSSGMSRSDATLEDSNYNFSGITNVSRSGVAIPVVYGEMFVGSVLVSNGIDTHQSNNPRAITSN